MSDQRINKEQEARIIFRSSCFELVSLFYFACVVFLFLIVSLEICLLVQNVRNAPDYLKRFQCPAPSLSLASCGPRVQTFSFSLVFDTPSAQLFLLTLLVDGIPFIKFSGELTALELWNICSRHTYTEVRQMILCHFEWDICRRIALNK